MSGFLYDNNCYTIQYNTWNEFVEHFYSFLFRCFVLSFYFVNLSSRGRSPPNTLFFTTWSNKAIYWCLSYTLDCCQQKLLEKDNKMSRKKFWWCYLSVTILFSSALLSPSFSCLHLFLTGDNGANCGLSCGTHAGKHSEAKQ